MSSETKIKMDGGALVRAADGRVTLGGRAGCLTWGLLVLIGPAALGALALTVSLVPRLFDRTDSITLDVVVEALGIALFLGFATRYLFNKIKAGKVTLNPVTRLIRVGKREIPFSEVERMTSRSDAVPLMDGVNAVTFLALLKSQEQVSLGNITVETGKMDDREAQILAILSEALTK